MNEGNVILVVLIVIGIIVAANGMMFLAARAWVRGGKTARNFFDSARDTLGQTFRQEDKSLDELRSKINQLQNAEKDEQKSDSA
jgi:hypothetical protein